MNSQGAYRKIGARRPRRSLASIRSQWESGDTQGAVKNKDRAYRAFSAEMVGQKPTGLRSYHDVLDLFQLHGEEVLAATMPPFEYTADPIEQRELWRDVMIKDGVIVPVQWGQIVYHVQETSLYMLRLTRVVFDTAWRTYWSARTSGEQAGNSWIGKGDEVRGAKLHKQLIEKAENEAKIIEAKLRGEEELTAIDLLSNPPFIVANALHSKKIDGSVSKAEFSENQSSSAEGGLGQTGCSHRETSMESGPFHENWRAPPAASDPNEPFMRDGSHLLASERGRRKIDPVTGKRMIRRMVLTEEAWPHYEWIEDVEGEFGVGPHGPECSFGMPNDPRMLSPREAWRPYLEKMGRLDLLHCFMPGPNDADQSNPPKPYYCYPKDYTGPRR